MTRFITLLCSIFLLPGLASSATDVNLNLVAVDSFIIPSYQKLADSTASLDSQAKKSCASGSQQNLAALRAAFNRAFDDWQGIQLIRSGPIEILLRGNRYQMWPDKRGTVARHLRQLLKAQDKQKLNAEQFEKSSIAIQGFSAMEQLLYDNNTAPQQFVGKDGASYECRTLQAIARNMSTMSKELLSEWSQGGTAHRLFIASAAQGNDYYESEAEVSSKLLNNLHTAVQIIAEQKLARPLGNSSKKARGQKAESWRSRRSLRNIHINLEAARQLYRLAFAPRISDTHLRQKFEDAFTSALQQTDSIKSTLFDAVKDTSARAQVEALQNTVTELKALLAVQLPEATGIPLGFNSLDGD